MVKFNGVNHLAMVTGDMDTTIRFWRDLLGMRLIAGLGHPGTGTISSKYRSMTLLRSSSGPGSSLHKKKTTARR